MNTTGRASERLRQLEAASRSDRSAVAQPALRILGHVAEQHFVAILAGLERVDADARELRDLAAELAAIDQSQVNAVVHLTTPSASV